MEKQSRIAGDEPWWIKPMLLEIQDFQGNKACNYFCQSQALKNLKADFPQKNDKKVKLAQKIHETGFLICFLLSGLWVRERQKTSSESKNFYQKDFLI